MKKKVFDMGKNTAKFIPDIWSQKFLDKFYDELVLPNISSMFAVPHFVRTLTAEIKRLSEEGLTPEQIAEKIDLNPWKGTYLKFGRIENFKLYESQVDQAAQALATQVDEEIMKSISEADMAISITKAEVELSAIKLQAEVRQMQAEIEAQLVASVMSSIGPQVEVSPLPNRRSLLMKGLTAEIKKLSEAGLTSEEIAEKIDPEKIDQSLYVWKGKDFNTAKALVGDKSITIGRQVMKPGGYGILGTTS
jgi:hypothetical protein